MLNFVHVFLIFVMCFSCSCKDSGGYQGVIVPLNFIPMHAPENSIRTGNMISVSSGIKLASVLSEGQKVKKGDVIAEFQFHFDNAKKYVLRDYNNTKARKEQELLLLSKGINELSTQLKKNKIKADMAYLETRKKSLVSANKRKIIEYEYKQQSVEHDAIEQKLATEEKRYDFRKQYFDRRLKELEIQLQAIENTRKRYTVIAPADGILSYPLIQSKKNKKISAGDSMSCGTHFLSLITSSRFELLFYLPEKDLNKLKPGDKIIIETSQQSINAKVYEIDSFPKMFGTILNNYSLPNAWDNCFAVRASLPEDLDNMQLLEGDIKVRIAQ